MSRLTYGVIQFVWAVLAALLPGLALAVCSVDYHGMATINEVHRSGNATRFIEVKILSSSIQAADYRQWQVEACVPGWLWNTCATFSLGDPQVQGESYPWIVIPKSMLDRDIINFSGMDLILRDGQGRTIDYLSVAGESGLQDSSCTPAFDWTHPGGNTHTIFRNPDGTGDWTHGPGNSAGSTNGDDNNSREITGPNLSISNAQATQGSPLTFTVTLSALHNEPITVDFETSDDTAQAGTHYRSLSGTVTIPAGRWSTSVQVESLHSQTISDVRFFLNLSNASNARIMNQVGIGTITPPSLQCLTDSFSRASLGEDWAVSHSNGSFGNPRIQDGRLMLTDASNNVATLASLQRQFPAQGNLVMIEFDHFAYGNYVPLLEYSDGGDGMAMVLSDSRIEPRAGSYGGSLGYAQRTGEAGFAGGWLGIGLDEYGNFSSPTEGRVGGPGLRPQSVTLRGAVASNYRWLATTQLSGQVIDHRDWWPWLTPSPGYRYRIWIDSRAEGQSLVSVERNTGGGFQRLLGPLNVLANSGQAPVPERLRLSFTGSTGDRTNYHALDNLQVCALQMLPVRPQVGYFQIDTTDTGSTCAPHEVIITARDAAGGILTGYEGTIELSTTSGHGNWRRLQAQGSLVPELGESDNGRASYRFSPQDQGRIRLNLENAHADALHIEVRDLDGGVLSRSELVQFRDNLLVISTADNLGADLIAGRDHGFKAVLWQQDPQKSECAIATGYDGNFSVKAWLERDSSDPGGKAPTIVANAGTANLPNGVPADNNLTLSFDQGEARFALRTSDVGRYTLRLRDDSSGFAQNELGQPLVIDSSAQGAPWTVRPFALRVTAEDNPAAANAQGPVYRRAGEDFRLRVAGVLYEATDDTDDDGKADHYQALADNDTTPSFGREGAKVALSSQLRLPNGGNDPGLEGPLELSVFVNGEAVHQYRFPDVGIIEVGAQIVGGDYLGSPGSGKLIGTSGPIGRFIPDRFEVEQEGIARFAPECTGGFTYLGQEFGYAVAPEFLIKPLNRSGAITQNYQGDFVKLEKNHVGLVYPAQDNGLGIDVERTGPAGDVLAEEGTGVLRYTLSLLDRLAYHKPTTPVAPFASNIRPRVTKVEDSDGVKADTLASSPLELLVETDGPPQLYGRWRLENAYGPETQALQMPFAAEYWNGTRFMVNIQDQCSPYELPNDATLSTSLGVSLMPTGMSQLQDGLPASGREFQLSAPGAPGPVDVEWTVPAWLQYDWDGDGSLDNPAARAWFGQYRGHDRIIYWREVGL